MSKGARKPFNATNKSLGSRDLVVSGNCAAIPSEPDRYSPLMISQASVNFEWRQQPIAPCGVTFIHSGTGQDYGSPGR